MTNTSTEELRETLLRFARYCNGLTPYKLNDPVDVIVDAAIESYVNSIESLTQKAVEAARIDENEIWLAHSTARRLNDNEPAIRTVDFKDRISELHQNNQREEENHG